MALLKLAVSNFLVRKARVALTVAAIALPAYNDYTQRAKLTEAFTGMSDFRVRMEQFYQDNRRYDGPGLDGCGGELEV